MILLRACLRTLVRSAGIGTEPGVHVANPNAVNPAEGRRRSLHAVFAPVAEPLYFAGGMG